jgi:hypothetical protein
MDVSTDLVIKTSLGKTEDRGFNFRTRKVTRFVFLNILFLDCVNLKNIFNHLIIQGFHGIDKV